MQFYHKKQSFLSVEEFKFKAPESVDIDADSSILLYRNFLYARGIMGNPERHY
jgi:hypothetical protein